MHTRKLLSHFVIAATGVAVAISPATASPRRQSSGYRSIDAMSDAGRYGVGRVYRNAGDRACGPWCGRAAQRGGTWIYDRSRDGATYYGERLRNWSYRATHRRGN